MNRGFLYGDGFFETIRIWEDEVPLLNWHLRRAQESAELLEMTWCDEWTENDIRTMVKNQGEKGNVVRLDFFRSGGGTYVPESDEMEMEVSVRSVEDVAGRSVFIPGQTARADLNRQLSQLESVPVGFYFAEKKPIYSLSGIKSTSALFYVKAGLYLKRQDQVEDLIIVNDSGNVCEGLSSNVLVRKDGKWSTPANHQGAVKGVYLQFLRSFMDIRPSVISIEELVSCEEVYLVNAVRGWRRALLV